MKIKVVLFFIVFLNALILSAQTYTVGEKAEVYYPPDNKWYTAEIIADHGDNTYKVHYDVDNTTQDYVPADRIKKLINTNDTKTSAVSTKSPVNAGGKANSKNICLTQMEKDIVDYINAKRRESGLNTLSLSQNLILTANKNVQESVNKTYISYAPNDLFKYTGESAKIQYSTSGNSAQDIWNGLSNKSQYDNKYQILFNDGEYKNKQWNAIGICIRSTENAQYGTMSSICIITGTSEEQNKDVPVCPGKAPAFDIKAMELTALPRWPVFELSTDATFTYSVEYLDKTGKWQEDHTERENAGNKLKYIDLNTHTYSNNKDKGIKKYRISVIQFNPSILRDKWNWIEFEVDASQTDTIHQKKIIFPGNSIAEIDEYLQTHDINTPDSWDMKDENAQGKIYTIKKQEPMLYRAAGQDNLAIADYLIKKGASIYGLTNFKESAFDACQSDEMFNLLLSTKPDMSKLNANKDWLGVYARNGMYEGVKYVVEELKTPVDFQSKTDKEFNVTPLSAAVGAPTRLFAEQGEDENRLRNKAKVVEYLLSKGANPNFPVHETHIPICVAAYKADLNVVKLLVKYGANVNVKDGAGQTPLKSIAHFENSPYHSATYKPTIDYLRSIGAK
ncbi:MAG: uncharacterized protein K0S33_1533 [Bacteroidetes bacterium]|jgi:hypothetical protein|nr:uncharacterized protein [Bacteroidota bacterium]